MHLPSRGPLWLVRTALLAMACTGLAWAGHAVWAGGDTTALSFPLATGFTALAVAPFTRSQRGFGEIFGVLAAAQAVTHILFVSTGPAAAHPAAVIAHVGPCVLGYSPGMLAGHLWAALLAAALLSRGETALWSLSALLGYALPRLLEPPGPLAVPPLVPARRPALRPASGPPLRLRTRGPPFGAPLPSPRAGATTEHTFVH
ncbi:hypothetical protein [Marinitenerispora sediminis]|uniref:hypothetical protein n=1 Tax=Marinitenerispora sediminis TaxID=1931232 RepID=UPI0015F1BB44|nr:hypothetical protein [Marinitenerispora sediminis]